MPVWQPESADEYVLGRVPVVFASGAAVAVCGMRWFRDAQRRDIQGELPGWPPGPVFTPKKGAERHGRRVLRGAGRVVGTLVMAALTGGGAGGVSVPGRPEDPPNETADFPVLWGDAGSVARTLPWQLDISRRPRNYRTHLTATDRRLLITGFPHADEIHDEVLWQVDRDAVSSVRRKDFSAFAGDGYRATRCDMQIAFADESWCRLASHYRDEICEYLVDGAEPVPLNSLSAEQRARVEEFCERHAGEGSALVTLRDDGIYRVDVRDPAKADAFSGMFAASDFMDRTGGDPDDS
ncbi:hypothetical protein [Streptomyces physcomitrii]|uniref:Uncharacterized protein n=1 Tax=Streptomyces physcomitrii TaxID=2724184 RepID=A0ABX1GVW9_9ACTN|nr:hypothetical protein [Streptomyces physcomitrii]NKI39888.1 hypothetical protein [Streptomyces physcomitrii]